MVTAVSRLPKAQSLPIVASRLDAVTPLAVLEIPDDGVAQPAFKAVTRRPSELAANLARVDGIAAIVAGAIGDKRFQRVTTRRLTPQFVEQIADAIDDLQVGPLAAATDIILFARPPLLQHGHDSGTVIVHVEPVTNVPAVSIDGQRPLIGGVQDRERNQLLRKLERSVVVRTV